ncbi:MAG: HAD family hydrolase [Candidatus Omnitrophica bacterium]|nr:HAD family hydrolase [Candidatus Omnitrophota bacterium]MDD5237068.1 HAD family hydrolase [Candidatus Omnitrophota bacterium]MDD5610192.1 HAD family hydrolase [Candidatus Omnitrophota bacterium]
MKAVFLDRDGVINKYPGDFQYVTSWKQFQFLPGVKEAIKKLTQAGFKIFVISNQAGVSKGLYSEEGLNTITRNMLAEIKKEGGSINEVFYCTHLEENNCACRKPKTGLIDLAIKKLNKENLSMDFSHSFFVGDTIRDIRTGKSAGLKTILVFSGKEKAENKENWQISPDFVASDLKSATEIILGE